MSGFLLFVAGMVAGLILAGLGVLVSLLLPDHPHDSVRPEFYAVAGDRPMLRHGSAAHGAAPHDWSGPVWNPRARMTEVPTRIARTELH